MCQRLVCCIGNEIRTASQASNCSDLPSCLVPTITTLSFIILLPMDESIVPRTFSLSYFEVHPALLRSSAEYPEPHNVLRFNNTHLELEHTHLRNNISSSGHEVSCRYNAVISCPFHEVEYGMIDRILSIAYGFLQLLQPKMIKEAQKAKSIVRAASTSVRMECLVQELRASVSTYSNNIELEDCILKSIVRKSLRTSGVSSYDRRTRVPSGFKNSHNNHQNIHLFH
ncbi:hypothetical protein Tco_1106502 [Tanacetum coccineum]